MAKIDVLELADRQRVSLHSTVHATYMLFEHDGLPVLQIDTFGRADRQIPGKVSQSIQFGPEGIAALRKILERLDAP